MRRVLAASIAAIGLLVVVVGTYLYARHLWMNKSGDVYAIVLVIAGALLIFFGITENGEVGWKNFFIRFAKAPENVPERDPTLTDDQWQLHEHLKHGTSTGESYETTIADKLDWSPEKVAKEAEVLRKHGMATWRMKYGQPLWSCTKKGIETSRPRS